MALTIKDFWSMTINFKNRTGIALLSLAVLFALTKLAPAQTAAGDTIDISNYKIYAEMEPDNHILKAQTAVTFKALKQTQSAVFEMNGSLVISNIKGPDGRTDLQFIQDRVNELNVKVNLGQLYPAGSELTLTFEYACPLATPEGGPINDTRLAYAGPAGSYP